MKLSFKLLCCLLLFVLVSCSGTKENSVTVAGSENQWPMSGGPDGSWKVETALKVPTKWSVRTGENIKWKKTLPEGGQSGIAVWGDKIFFTINPPNDDPKHAIVLEDHKHSKHVYDSIFNFEVKNLSNKRDLKFLKLKRVLKRSKKKWQSFLESDESYKAASDSQKENISRRLMRRSDIGKTHASNLKEFDNYVRSQSKSLMASFQAYMKLTRDIKGGETSKDIILYCLNANSGETLWRKTVKGTFESQYNYGFSDATTPCPMTDGNHIWAINASGGMACFTMTGDLVWERTWNPTDGGKPFNKQFDSVLFEDLILNVEPPEDTDTTRIKDWNYLHAFDKNTGERLWVTKEALTHYNTPILGETSDGKPAILMGRGGPHEVPERPVGLSLISLDNENQGSALWNWEPKEENNVSGWGALSTQHWDSNKALWFYNKNEHGTINSKTGAFISKKKLNIVNKYRFDIQKNEYVLDENVTLEHHENQRHCNISVGDNIFYLVRYSPFIARHNVITGKNDHIELPHEIDENGDYIWGVPQKNDGLNSKGQLHAFDSRTWGDGFQKCFLGSPTMINNYIYFTNAIGMVYVLDATAERFDESAIVAINDLGEKGKTWTVNSISFANGNIYHRTMKEIICIGE